MPLKKGKPYNLSETLGIREAEDSLSGEDGCGSATEEQYLKASLEAAGRHRCLQVRGCL